MASSPKSRGLGNISPIVNRSGISSSVKKPVAKMPVPKPVTTTFAQRKAAPSPFKSQAKPMAKVNPLQQAMQPKPRTDIPPGAQMRTPVQRPAPQPTPGQQQFRDVLFEDSRGMPLGPWGEPMPLDPQPNPGQMPMPEENAWSSSYDKLRNSSVYDNYRQGNQKLINLTQEYQQKYGLPGGTFEGLRANGLMSPDQQAALDADPRYQELKKYSPGLFQRYLGSINAGDNADIQRFQQAEQQRKAGLDPKTGLPPGVQITPFGGSVGGFDMQPTPGQQPAPVNSRGDFFDSQEYKNFGSDPSSMMGTMDTYDSPYFGMQGSGSIGKGQDRAYEAYLQRTGQKAGYGIKKDYNNYDPSTDPKSPSYIGYFPPPNHMDPFMSDDRIRNQPAFIGQDGTTEQWNQFNQGSNGGMGMASTNPYGPGGLFNVLDGPGVGDPYMMPGPVNMGTGPGTPYDPFNGGPYTPRPDMGPGVGFGAGLPNPQDNNNYNTGGFMGGGGGSMFGGGGFAGR